MTTNPNHPFTNFDLARFWKDSDYDRKMIIEAPPGAALVASIEAELGYKLPASYVALMRSQNGGSPVNTCHPTATPTGWAEDHVAISHFKAIGRAKAWSLCGELGSQFKIDEWDYPAIGVYFGDCPSAGHDMVALDYRQCGPRCERGEPQVVHVDQDAGYAITVLAPDFESFVRGLVHGSRYDPDPEEERKEWLQRVRDAPFSDRLRAWCDAWPDPAMPTVVRTVAAAIVQDKGFFALHADERSWLMYDLQFLLYSHHRGVERPVRSLEAWLQSYSGAIAMAHGGCFGTGGWAQHFVEDWFHARVKDGELVQAGGGWQFSPAFQAGLLQRLGSLR